MFLEGIQSEDLCKICSGAGDKKTMDVNTQNALNNHQILTDHDVFHPQALYNLEFELTLAPVLQVAKGSDETKLKYKLTKLQLHYKMIRSKTLAVKLRSVYW